MKKLTKYLLSLLGIGTVACMPAMMYGTPHADFKVTGRITTDVPEYIEGIQVIMETQYSESDTSYSDIQGLYYVSGQGFPQDQSFLLKFRDIDGEHNGTFEPLDTLIEFKNPHFENGDEPWYEGEAVQSLNVTLIKKN